MKKLTLLFVAIALTLNVPASNNSGKIGVGSSQLSSFLLSALLITQEGSFYQNVDDGKIYVFFEGEWTWIYNWKTYSDCFDIPEVEAKMVYGSGAPSTSPWPKTLQGFLGIEWVMSGNNWITDGNVYFYEVGAYGPVPNAILSSRHITSPTVFDRYCFDWQKIRRLNIGLNFSGVGRGNPIY